MNNFWPWYIKKKWPETCLTYAIQTRLNIIRGIVLLTNEAIFSCKACFFVIGITEVLLTEN